MEKSKSGIKHIVIAILAVAFAILQQPLAVLLVLGFAALVEKDKSLTKGVFLITALSVVNSFLLVIISGFFSFLANALNRILEGTGFVVLRTIPTILGTLLTIVFIVAYVFLIIKMSKGQEINIAFVNKLFDFEEPGQVQEEEKADSE